MRRPRFIILSRIPLPVKIFSWGFTLLGACGVSLMLFGLGQITVGSEDGPSRPATPADAWGPGLFLLVGVGLWLIRYRNVIDVTQQKRISEIGWGWWVKRSEVLLSSATRIDLGPEEMRGTGSGRYSVIPVIAVGPTGIDELSESRTVAQARKLAERIATGLDLPVGQGLITGNDKRRHQHGDFAPALTEQFSAADLRPPENTTVTLTESQHGLAITYPMTGISWFIVMFSVAVPVLAFSCFWWFVWRPGLVEAADQSRVLWVFMIAPVITGFVVGLFMLLAHFRTGMLGRRIRLGTDGRFTASGRSIPGAGIRSVEINASGGIGNLKVGLDDGEFTTAAGMSEPELRWIRAVIIVNLQQRYWTATQRSDPSAPA